MSQRITRREAARRARHFEKVDATRMTDVTSSRRPLSAKEEIARMVKFEIDRIESTSMEKETGSYEDEDDFEDEETEPLWVSGYEIHETEPDEDLQPGLPDDLTAELRPIGERNQEEDPTIPSSQIEKSTGDDGSPDAA